MATGTPHRLLHGLAALALALAPTGCTDLFPPLDETTGGLPGGPPIDPDPDITQPNPTRGGLLNGSFYYICTGDRDPACIGDAPQDFPARLALGGAFYLEYKADPGYILPITVANPDRLTYATGAFRALTPGPVALLVYEHDHVRDLLNVQIAAPATIEIQRNQAEVLALSLELGEEAALVAVAHSDEGHGLAGTLQYRWSIEGDSVAIVDEQGPGGVRLQATAPGDASLTLSLADLTVTVPVKVVSDLPGGTSTGGSSTGDGSTGSTGSTGDGSTGGTASTGDTGTTGDMP